MKKVFEYTIKLFLKDNKSPTVASHMEGDDQLLRNQDIGLLIIELEKLKATLLSYSTPDAEAIQEDISDQVQDDN